MAIPSLGFLESFESRYSKGSWHPAMTANATLASYWLNWRFFVCAIWVLISTTVAMILIWKNEIFGKSNRHIGETVQQETAATMYEDDTWRPCLKGVHPAWLLAYRLIAFFVLMVLLIVTALVNGGSIFYYYTQWTFTLITIYFGLGSILSIYGCYQYHKRVSGDKVDNVEADAEQGTHVTASPIDSNISNITKNPDSHEEHGVRQSAGLWAHAFQIIFQMNAGAVLLTDCVFWLIMVPFLAQKDYHLNVLAVNMHSLNAIFLLGDSALNCLRFPLFRIAYFLLWTVVYVIFQWTLHACVYLWWPYPFLDLSSSYAPLWYLVVGVMHIPCYGGFALTIKLKHYLLSKLFPHSYQCPR
ncbi:hypothetical protein CFOL_v3_01898 [Cephalotus follicularis]|uniref:Uncharacterized protein n=1 Tax=Cephalotus follicularis TaxID=3775 RepID=A0A1Q3ARR5_CEPFO|nr:hypothetical protein CFOL_v3_01898 [Cephalotus follicularis]